MLGFVRAGDADIWVGYNTETGHIVGEVRKHSYDIFGVIYSVWVPSVRGGMIPQGEHKTLDDAKYDLRNWDQ